MNRLHQPGVFLTGVVLLFSLVAALAAPIPVHLFPLPPFYSVKPRSEWVYAVTYPDSKVLTTEIIEKVENVDGVEVISLSVAHDRELKGMRWRESVTRKMELRADGLYHIDPWPEVGETDIRLLPLPLVVGDTWEEKHPKMKLKRKCKVFAQEKIKVPAGEFEAVRIETYYEFEDKQAYHFSDEWYARGVGLVKRHTLETERVQILKSFKPGKDAP